MIGAEHTHRDGNNTYMIPSSTYRKYLVPVYARLIILWCSFSFMYICTGPGSSLRLVWPQANPAFNSTYMAYAAKNWHQGRLRRLPMAFAIPSKASDLSTVIKCANMAGIRWTIRGGGHGYEVLYDSLREISRAWINHHYIFISLWWY